MIVSPSSHVDGSSLTETPCPYHLGTGEALQPSGWALLNLRRQTTPLAGVHEAFFGVQWDPAWPRGKFVRRALSEEALLLENWQPMICYDLWWLSLPGHGLWSVPLGGVDVLLRWGSPSLQP